MRKQDDDRRYADWYLAYVEDVRDRVKHWGDKRGHAVGKARSDALAIHNGTDLDGALFAPGE
jgi:hypothetical protein